MAAAPIWRCFASDGIAREDGTSLADNQLFRIASMTKPITSVAFMQLVEQGKVALDDPVHRVLPEFKNIGVYAGGGGELPFTTTPTEAPMRIVDLLRHTSGLTYAFQNRSNVDLAYRERKIEKWHGNHDLESYVAELGTLPLEFSPGTAWNYSVSTDVLGAVIQRVSGQTLDTYFADHIFAPLGMEDTGFTVPDDKLDRLGDCWLWDAEGTGAVRPGGEEHLVETTQAALRRRRPGFDVRRLYALLQDVAR